MVELEKSPTTQNPEQSRPLSPELASDILFASFEHSQGRPHLQLLILKAIKINNPDWSIDNVMKSEISAIALPKIQRHIAAHSEPHSDKDSKQERKVLHPSVKGKSITGELELRLEEMQSVFHKPIPDGGISYYEIAELMVQQDFQFLSQCDGRLRRNADPNTPQGDPFLSFVCYYGYEGHTTRIPELDRVYKDVRDAIIRSRYFSGNNEADYMLYTVETIYEAHHPKTN